MRYIRRRCKEAQGKGLTFLELVIVTALLGIISLAIYATFAAGIRIWKRASAPLAAEDIDIFLDTFTADARSTFVFKKITFAGKEASLEFPVLVNSRGMGLKSVGKAVYLYDDRGMKLTREELDYSQAYRKEGAVPIKTLENVASMKFTYYSYDEKDKKYLWAQEWAKEKPPLAIRMELKLGGNGESENIARTVSIPVSN